MSDDATHHDADDTGKPARLRAPRGWNILRAASAVAVLGVAGCAADGATSSVPRDGAAVYAQHCASCHGAELEGAATGPPLLSIVYEPGHHPDESFRAAIRNGVAPHHWDFGPMPIVGGVSDAEVDAVIAHVRSVQETEGFLAYDP
jgi:mono/diheme cytochrome c family protein